MWVIAVLAVAGCNAAQQETTPPPDTTTAEMVRTARELDLDGQHVDAVALYRQVIDRAPNSFDAHYGIGRALDLAGQYGEAQQHFARAIELAPEGSRDQALRMMGVSWVFVNDVAAAAPYFREVFDRRMATGNVVAAAEVANELGRVYLEAGEINPALEWYRTGYETMAGESTGSAALADLAEFRWAHAQARIAARRGDAAEARRHENAVEELLEKDSLADERVHYPYLQGYVAFHLGDVEAAIDALQQADQQDPFILMLLAQALEQSGRPEEARVRYRDVLTSSSHAVTNAFARPVAREKLALSQ